LLLRSITMKQDMREELEIAEGVIVSVSNGLFQIKGSKGELKRDLSNPRIKSSVVGNTIIFESERATQREKRLIKARIAHLKYMMIGVVKGHTYKLKICASHFPMTAAVKGSLLEIKNFIGETVPRIVKLPVGINVKVDGQFIIVEGISKELTGQTALSIEQATRRPGFDKRIFQDGIYIIEKDGKHLKA
jgi:large subunit ribosomal protein L6